MGTTHFRTSDLAIDQSARFHRAPFFPFCRLTDSRIFGQLNDRQDFQFFVGQSRFAAAVSNLLARSRLATSIFCGSVAFRTGVALWMISFSSDSSSVVVSPLLLLLLDFAGRTRSTDAFDTHQDRESEFRDKLKYVEGHYAWPPSSGMRSSTAISLTSLQ